MMMIAAACGASTQSVRRLRRNDQSLSPPAAQIPEFPAARGATTHITIACGANTRIFRRLRRKYPKSRRPWRKYMTAAPAGQIPFPVPDPRNRK